MGRGDKTEEGGGGKEGEEEEIASEHKSIERMKDIMAMAGEGERKWEKAKDHGG